jgi:hypothetical protein
MPLSEPSVDEVLVVVVVVVVVLVEELALAGAVG